MDFEAKKHLKILFSSYSTNCNYMEDWKNKTLTWYTNSVKDDKHLQKEICNALSKAFRMVYQEQFNV
jgi:hypothetical protein